MKINQTVMKEMSLDELIKWAWENDVKDRNFDNGSYWIRFGYDGYIMEAYNVSSRDTFTVETTEEIEIDEHTEIPLLIEVYISTTRNKLYSKIHENISIDHVLKRNEGLYECRYIYTLKPDGMPDQLLWAKGKVVNDDEI